MPSFRTGTASDATVTFKGAGQGGSAPLRFYVGDHEARALPVADTDPSTALGATVQMTPGTYRGLAVGAGVGHTRFTFEVKAGQVRDLPVQVVPNLASAAAARKDGATAEELHALDYQAYAYLQTAQDAAARGNVGQVDALASKVTMSGPGNAAPPAAGHYALNAIPARFALEREAWTEAAALTPRETPTACASSNGRSPRSPPATSAGRCTNASPAVRSSTYRHRHSGCSRASANARR